MAIEIVEPELPTEFVGKVDSVKKEKGKYGDQFHITIIPTEKEWKPIHTWISIGKGSNEEKVQRGSSLHEWIQRLNKMGMNADTLTDVFLKMVGSKFRFKQEKIGNSQKEKWVVSKLEEGVFASSP